MGDKDGAGMAERYQGDYTGDYVAADQAWSAVANLSDQPFGTLEGAATSEDAPAPENTPAPENIYHPLEDDVAPQSASEDMLAPADDDLMAMRTSTINTGLGEGTQADGLRKRMQQMGRVATERLGENEEAPAHHDLPLRDEMSEVQEETPVVQVQEEVVEAQPGAEEQREIKEQPEVEAQPEAKNDGVEVAKTRELAEKDFEDWQKWVTGTLDEFWKKLRDKQWAEYNGIEIGEQAPQFEELRVGLERDFRRLNPRVPAEAMAARIDLATKMAMEQFAEKKAKALAEAKVRPKRKLFSHGEYERAMPKTYDNDLEKVLQGNVQDAVYEQYVDHALLRRDMQQDELSRREKLSWWRMMEPDKAQDLETGMGVRMPFQTIEQILGNPETPVEKLDWYSNLQGIVAERMALIPDGTAMYARFAKMVDEITSSLMALIHELMAATTRDDRWTQQFAHFITDDNLALEMLRSQGVLARTGEIAEQLAELERVEHAIINKLSELVAVRQDAEVLHDEQGVAEATIEYDYYRDLLMQVFAARRALLLIQERGEEAVANVISGAAEPEAPKVEAEQMGQIEEEVVEQPEAGATERPETEISEQPEAEAGS